MNGPLFELKGVYFSYLGKYPALCGIDMNIHAGEKIAVIGANGTGKSTLLQLLDGLIFPDKGNISFSGRDLSEKSFDSSVFSREFRGKVGLVFQNPDIQLFCPTVREDIVFGPLQLGIDVREIEKRLDDLSALLGIKHLLGRAPHQLSIGEKRKVSIASTLAMDPEVIILDEPTAGLDPQTTRHIIDLINQANQDGKTIITATHDLHIIEEISDTVYAFSGLKKISRSGPTEELLKDTVFLTENNLMHVHQHRHKDKVHVHPHVHLDHHPEEENPRPGLESH
jgi:cobalt/nickel transport system ATP-binding protein